MNTLASVCEKETQFVFPNSHMQVTGVQNLFRSPNVLQNLFIWNFQWVSGSVTHQMSALGVVHSLSDGIAKVNFLVLPLFCWCTQKIHSCIYVHVFSVYLNECGSHSCFITVLTIFILHIFFSPHLLFSITQGTLHPNSMWFFHLDLVFTFHWMNMQGKLQ